MISVDLENRLGLFHSSSLPFFSSFLPLHWRSSSNTTPTPLWSWSCRQAGQSCAVIQQNAAC